MAGEKEKHDVSYLVPWYVFVEPRLCPLNIFLPFPESALIVCSFQSINGKYAVLNHCTFFFFFFQSRDRARLKKKAPAGSPVEIREGESGSGAA